MFIILRNYRFKMLAVDNDIWLFFKFLSSAHMY